MALEYVKVSFELFEFVEYYNGYGYDTGPIPVDDTPLLYKGKEISSDASLWNSGFTYTEATTYPWHAGNVYDWVSNGGIPVRVSIHYPVVDAEIEDAARLINGAWITEGGDDVSQEINKPGPTISLELPHNSDPAAAEGRIFSFPSHIWAPVSVPTITEAVDDEYIVNTYNPPEIVGNVLENDSDGPGEGLKALRQTIIEESFTLKLFRNGDVKIVEASLMPDEYSFEYTIVDAEGARDKAEATILMGECSQTERLKEALSNRGGALGESAKELAQLRQSISLAEDLLEAKQAQYVAASQLQTLALVKFAANTAFNVLTILSPAKIATKVFGITALKVIIENVSNNKPDYGDNVGALLDGLSVLASAASKKLKVSKELAAQSDEFAEGWGIIYTTNRPIFDIFDQDGEITLTIENLAKARFELVSLAKQVSELRAVEREMSQGLDMIKRAVENFDCNHADQKQFIEDLMLILKKDGFSPALGGPSMQSLSRSELTLGSDNNDKDRGLAGDDVTFGGSGNDKLLGNKGNDGLFGEAGKDILYGGKGSDFLDGGRGNDTLFGGAGRDILIAGNGRDNLTGGSGDDRFVFDLRHSKKVNVVEDFSEGDQLVIYRAAWEDVSMLSTQKGNLRVEVDDRLTVVLKDYGSPLTDDDFVFV
ncbi:calcium-binding protein [Sedimentitalea sp.]|uniref:calcium-binding protein n=1 Tax=Sedimentitalea sp. TaxID=2048915 RepID=UPI003296FA21